MPNCLRNLSVCKAWCCTGMILIRDTLTKDEEYYIKLHGGVIFIKDGHFEIFIRVPCHNLTSKFRCRDYANRPELCKNWNCTLG